MGEFAIGQSVSRFEDPRLLKGGGRYVGDMMLPGMAFGHVLRSPHAHARIRAVDVSRAKAAPGVLAVLTGADWAASAAALSPNSCTKPILSGQSSQTRGAPCAVASAVETQAGSGS